jgi:hypothetical protein
MRRWLAVLVTSLAVVATCGAPAFAFGYRSTGADPDDVNATGAVDIRGTTRKVWVDNKGRAWFTLTIRAYEPLGGSYGMTASLDARGGPLRDERISVSNGEGPPGCALDYHLGGGWLAPAVQSGERVTCVFEFRKMKANKLIRWRVVAGEPGDEQDRAPDRRFYS